MSAVGEAGRRGPDVRSDCWVRIEPKSEGGLAIDLVSKVDALYGQSIRGDCEKELSALGVPNAGVRIEDAGALPFVLSARIEAAVRRALPETQAESIPEQRDVTRYQTDRNRFRRTRLYIPGNEPKFMVNAGLHGPDGLIFDLEDAVAHTEKDAARILVRNALRQVDTHGCERMVRINQLPSGFDDLSWVVPHNVHVLLVPKCEDADALRELDERLESTRNAAGVQAPVFLMPIIESAKGVIRAYEIAVSSPNIVALAVGLEDYTADIGVARTREGQESLWARSMVINAARAAGIQPLDTVYSDVADMDGLAQSALEAKALGFDGKGCIHPRQIAPIHEALAPTREEVKRATRIVLAFEQAEAEGLGVVSLGNKMIDPPVVKRAIHTVELGVATGRLDADWRLSTDDKP